MRRKPILGQETEYGMIIKSLPPDWEEAKIAKWLYHRFVLFHTRKDDVWKTDYFLANGGRFYYDAGDHPEYATPECLSARQLVCCSEAGDRLLEELQKEANEKLSALGLSSRIRLYKNNHDGKKHTYGCHENYSVKPKIFDSLTAYGSNAAKDFFLAYLTSSVIYAGAGDVIYDPKLEELKFVLSQRVRFVRCPVANSSPPFVPMIHGRNEAHADENRLARLHLMGRDSNMSQLATYLKFGTARIIIEMIEDGRFNRELALKNAIQSYRQFSSDPSLKFRAELKNGKKCTALEIQKMFLEGAMSHVSGCGDAEDKDIVEKWGLVLERLSRLNKEPGLLLGDVDWVAKKFFLENELGKITRRSLERGLKISSFRGRTRNSLNDFLNFAQAVNIQYHDIRRERGLYYRFQDGATRIVSAREIKKAITEPPKGGRAELRGFLVKKFSRPEMVLKYYVFSNWDAVQWRTRESLSRNIDLSDPYTNRLSADAEKLLPKEIKVPKKFRPKIKKIKRE